MAATTSTHSSSPSYFTAKDVSTEGFTCDCGPLKLYTSHTVENPGRRFWRCPKWRDKESTCKYFEWEDELNLDIR
ncbi:hypothetical protein RIF29_11468 [Crotalaria pallida]|uniref:GRF-type domain-containing protein n=1 Tax=Crotalaria pallida TaxID=3830 RepID=A0AAN9IMB6_CROPI